MSQTASDVPAQACRPSVTRNRVTFTLRTVPVWTTNFLAKLATQKPFLSDIPGRRIKK